MSRTQDPGARLFSFAVITDTHLNQGEDECNSPFAVNRLANRRLRHVVNDLNRRDLAFVINVGDLLHPVPAVPELYDQAADRYREQSAALRHQQYLVPGNHDVGDKFNEWAPTAIVCDDYLACWEKHFGPHYQAFDHGDCHFVIINAQIVNSGLTAEGKQRDWLEADLAANHGRRLFMFSHYPLFIATEDEPEHYDNIGDPGRSWLSGLLREHKVEAMFTGHVHNFWFNRTGTTDCYLLPSTAFVRQDYSEVYRAPPGPDDEAGRNDLPKLGYFLAHVHERGHMCEPVRSYGLTADTLVPPDEMPATLQAAHPRLARLCTFGFDMRQDWMDTVEVPPSGGLDEFDRKPARNDYPLLGLWEMGIRSLRIPLSDLATPDRRERLRALAQHGFEYTLFTFGAPDSRTQALIEENANLLTAWEAGFDMAAPERSLPGIVALARSARVPLYLSRLRDRHEVRTEAGRYYHFINHGFSPDDEKVIGELLTQPDIANTLSGLVFRLSSAEPVYETLLQIECLSRKLNLFSSVHLRTAGFNPAQAELDDRRIADRMAEALFTANTLNDVKVFADTLVDHDRGYFVRHGAYDRLCNPRPAAKMVQHLNALLEQYPDRCLTQACTFGSTPEYRLLTSEGERSAMQLFLPKAGTTVSLVRFQQSWPPILTIIDLETGRQVESVKDRPFAIVYSDWKYAGDQPGVPSA